MDFFDNFFSDTGNKSDSLNNNSNPSEMDIYKRFMGHFGFYSQDEFNRTFNAPTATNFLLTKLEADLHFSDVANRAKSEGYDFFIFATSSSSSTALKGQGYFGRVLDDKYDFTKNLSITKSQPNNLNIYPVYEPNQASTNIPNPISSTVSNYYIQQALTQTATKLKAEVETAQNNQKKAELLSLAYKKCRIGNPKDVEECVKEFRDKHINNMSTNEDRENTIKTLKDKLNILRLKNRYEAESNNHLINQNSNNNKFFTAIKSTLTDNYNSISNINNAILNVSNKLKTNTSIFSMKAGVVKALTSLGVIMIVLAIGFAAYFAYQAAKKYFPFTLQGFRASQAASSAPPRPSTSASNQRPNRFGNPSAIASSTTSATATAPAPSAPPKPNNTKTNSRRNSSNRSSSSAPNTLGF